MAVTVTLRCTDGEWFADVADADEGGTTSVGPLTVDGTNLVGTSGDITVTIAHPCPPAGPITPGTSCEMAYGADLDIDYTLVLPDDEPIRYWMKFPNPAGDYSVRINSTLTPPCPVGGGLVIYDGDGCEDKALRTETAIQFDGTYSCVTTSHRDVDFIWIAVSIPTGCTTPSTFNVRVFSGPCPM